MHERKSATELAHKRQVLIEGDHKTLFQARLKSCGINNQMKGVMIMMIMIMMIIRKIIKK